MSQMSTRSRGATKKPSSVPKLRKKVAPKVVSSRPKRNSQNENPQKDQESSETTQSNSTAQATDSADNSSSQTSLSSNRTIVESLNEDSNSIPLPTLPSEESSTNIHTSLQLPLSTPTEICTSDLFGSQDPTCIGDQEDGIGGELLNLHSEQISMTRSSTSTSRSTSETSSPTSELAGEQPSSGVQARTESIVTCTVLPEVRTVGEAVAAAGSMRTAIEEQSNGGAAPVCRTSPQTTSEQTRERPVNQTTDVSEKGTGTSTDGDQTTTAVSERPEKETRGGTDGEKVNNEKTKTSKKRSRADSTSKESGEQSPPSKPKRKRNTTARERKAPDRNTMTMQELIYYNPSANPMQAAREERERRHGSTAPPSPDKESPNEPETASTSEETRQTSSTSDETCQTGLEGGEASDDRIVPQLTIGADGNIIIDEASMVMATTQSANPYNDSEAIIETSGLVTSDSFRKGAYKITRWSKDETTKFFKALSHVGTDFTMMTLLVPNRSRKELKNKFKREEKKSPHLVAQALKNQVKVQKVSS